MQWVGLSGGMGPEGGQKLKSGSSGLPGPAKHQESRSYTGWVLPGTPPRLAFLPGHTGTSEWGTGGVL